MVSFKLRNEMWKWTDQHDTNVGQTKILSPQRESNPWPPKRRAGALSTELQQLMESNSVI